MTRAILDVSWDDARWESLAFDVEVCLERMATFTGDYVLSWSDTPYHVSVSLTSDQEIRPINAQFRGKDSPTNVLSFGVFHENVTKESWQALQHEGVPFFLGDIVLAFDTIDREARDERKSFENHLSHLMVHGLLHLLGYDHILEEEAQEMEALECKILSSAGIPNPYIIDEMVNMNQEQKLI